MKSNGLKITGNNKKILSVTLVDILECINNPININWTLLWIWATTKSALNPSILEIEKLVNDSPNGIIFTWEELEHLALSLNQAIEILLIGNRNSDNSIRYKEDDEMYEKCDYVVELFDSTFWQINSKDISFLKRAKDTLDGAEFLA